MLLCAVLENRTGFNIAFSSVSTAASSVYHLSVIVLAYEYCIHVVLSFIVSRLVKRSPSY